MNTTVDITNVSLLGYKLIESLYNGFKTTVYRGIQLSNSLQEPQPVAIKFLGSSGFRVCNV